MNPGRLGLFFLLIGMNGFFVGMELAVVASRRGRLDDGGEEPRSWSGRLLGSWLEDPQARGRMLAVSQLGVVLSTLTLGVLGVQSLADGLLPLLERIPLSGFWIFLAQVWPGLATILALLVVTGLYVVLAQQLPGAVVLKNPERFAVSGAGLMQVFGFVLGGLSTVLEWLTRLLLRLAGLPTNTSHSFVYSLDEIRQMVTGPETEGVIEEPEREMLEAVLDFSDLVVRQVSTPRTEIIAVPVDMKIEEALRVSVEHAVTKLPVYEDDLDEIIGVVHLHDLVRAFQEGQAQEVTLKDLSREPFFVPDSLSVRNLLHQFRAKRVHIAIVLDEFGGTSGLITLEDLMEEIVGDVQGPFDEGTSEIEKLPDGSYLLDGLLLIEDVNDYFELSLADPNYDTIAGYMMGRLDRIPQLGDKVEDREQRVQIRVEEMDGKRIERLSLIRLAG
ncbi:MAG: hemolysin family protein [Anaerolineaceae bacterium]|jgi:CBS domain containing-hemolysin-like protein|nr:hemolysin family protein [Anaerolineaceae bacterium]